MRRGLVVEEDMYVFPDSHNEQEIPFQSLLIENEQIQVAACSG